MTFDEIERRLRLPAPDEPTMLPALLLPVRVGTATLPDRTIELRLGRQRRPMSLAFLGTVMLLVAALVGALVVGALRIEQFRDALPIPGLYTGHGITLDYPDDWTRLTPHDPFGGSPSNVVLIVANRPVAGCEPDSEAVARHTMPPQPTPDEDGVVHLGSQSGAIGGLEDRMYDCLTEQPLAPGEARIVVSRDRPQAIELGPVGDFAGSWLEGDVEASGPRVSVEAGFTETIGQMPARLVVRDRSVVPQAEQLRMWFVAIPDSADSLWWVQAVMRGPDLAALEAKVDEIVGSLAFDHVPTPLDEGDQAVALATAVDAIDRSMRQYAGHRFLKCLPRTPGSATTTVGDGPRGRLATPLEVTCTTTVEANDLRVWEALLEVEWADGPGQQAGRWARRILFDVDGTLQRETDVAPGTGSPMGFPGDPSDVAVPNVVPTFQAGDLTLSVGEGAGTAFYDVDSTLLPPEPHLYPEPGALLVILAGPETYDGRDFYMADNGFEVGWVGAEAKGAVVLAAAEPSCPSVIDITELAYMSSLERHLCVSGELTLGPVQAGQPERDPSWDLVEASPAWLAAWPRWSLFGVGGRDGLDTGLPVSLGQGLPDLPTEGWLQVTGHFDDPASSTCVVTYPEDWNPAAGTPDAQIRRCLERFVVTSAIPSEAP